MVKQEQPSLNSKINSMQFEAYEAEDFLQDDSFLRYCLAANQEDVEFWSAWMAANPHKHDAVKQARAMYLMLNGNIQQEQFANDRRDFMASFERHTGLPLDEGRRRSSKKVWWYSGLAVASLLFAFFLLNFTGDKKDATSSIVQQYARPDAKNGVKSVELADGSKVMLNAGSVIKLAEDFNTSTREMYLEGEAYFEVAHDAAKPFIIHTSSMDVKVLGTVFNVRAYPADKESEASLISGSVEVTIQRDKRKIILEPNQKITLLNDDDEELQGAASSPVKASYQVKALAQTPSAPPEELLWTKGLLVFNDKRFEDIAHALNHWYNVQVVFAGEDVKSYRYSGTFENKSIDEVLAALQLSRHFNYTKEGDNIIKISSGG